ncbi:MAG: hypothetical protein AAF823_09955 [Planctomycetota bacterium]
MVSKLTRLGDDAAIPVSDELLRQVGIDDSTPLEVRVDDGRIVIERATDTEPDPAFRKAADAVFEERDDLLRRLA